LSNDALRHQVTEVLALVQEQMADVAAMQKKQAQLRVTGTAADGMVEVTVNAGGQLMTTVIDESYLDQHEFEELADHITEAAQAAARDAMRQVAEMLVPISERRKAFPSLSDVVEGAPDIRALTPSWLDPFGEAQSRQTQDNDDGGGDETAFPRVRR
jgi:DNA-binding protein YbaB